MHHWYSFARRPESRPACFSFRGRHTVRTDWVPNQEYWAATSWTTSGCAPGKRTAVVVAGNDFTSSVLDWRAASERSALEQMSRLVREKNANKTPTMEHAPMSLWQGSSGSKPKLARC